MKFPKLVIEEAENLKKFARPSELSRLNFHTLDPEFHQNCIYGQMTDSCFSIRAIELIEKCAKRVYDNEEHREIISDDKKVCEGVVLNGSPKEIIREAYFSSIEVFISKHPTKDGAGKLIQFLKGEIKTLD